MFRFRIKTLMFVTAVVAVEAFFVNRAPPLAVLFGYVLVVALLFYVTHRWDSAKMAKVREREKHRE